MLAEATESTEPLFFCLILTDGYARAPRSFLYSLRNNDDLPSFKSTLKNEDNQHAIARYDSLYGPIFGFGHDLYIANDAGLNNESHARFGTTYNLPVGYLYGQTSASCLMSGSYSFTPSEVEVLYLN